MNWDWKNWAMLAGLLVFFLVWFIVELAVEFGIIQEPEVLRQLWRLLRD